MKWLVWVLAIAIVAASFPLAISCSKQSVRKGNMAGASMIVGMAFMTIFDPKSAQAIEIIRSRKEIGDFEAGEDGEGLD